MITVASVFWGELVSWGLVYRTKGFKELKKKMDRFTKDVEKFKDHKNKERKQKKREVAEKALQECQRSMSMMNMKSTLVLAVTMISVLQAMSHAYDKVVLARLPFTPIGFLRGISHRGLEGDDFRACSYIFFYVITGMGLRANVKKALQEAGITPEMPKGTANTGMFGMPSQEEIDRKWGKMQ